MILVFGQTGQVAQELRRRLPDATFLSRQEADLADPAACAAAIHAHRPTAVINAAAWTAVDKAETEEAAATIINGDAPMAMAKACAELAIPFVHISTDYVFDGSGTKPWQPDDMPAPIGAYGRSKLAGEQGVAKAGGAHAILRTSWVFSAHGTNFVKTMLRLADRGALNVVSDQVGGPTAAADIADTCIAMANGLTADTSGIYHLAGGPDVSWADFARAIFDRAGLPVDVTDIPTSAYPTPAQRPANSRMDCAKLSAFGLARPDWRHGLDDVLQELGAIT